MQEDLRPFSRLLWQRGIAHRIHESAGKQTLSVEDPSRSALVETLWRGYQSGQFGAQQHSPALPRATAGRRWPQVLMTAPLTIVLVLGCLLGGLLVSVADETWLSLFTFQSWFDLGGARFYRPLLETLQAGQWWRLWSPIFLHFGLLHLVFNCLWLWEFGRRIEGAQGSARLLLLVVWIGLGSNCTQYYFARNIVFGGMSGVVYGLLGYCWGWSLLRPQQDFGIPKALVYAMIALMVLALSGIFTLFGFGAVANAAHFSGFFLGLGTGLLLAAMSTRAYDGISRSD
jgi:GlpG protein